MCFHSKFGREKSIEISLNGWLELLQTCGSLKKMWRYDCVNVHMTVQGASFVVVMTATDAQSMSSRSGSSYVQQGIVSSLCMPHG
jgi:hypothetical protein